MGRTSPLILRSGHISNNWKSHWFSDNNYTILLTEDLKIRYYINNVYYYLKLPTTETRINRPQNKIGLVFNNIYLPDYLKSLKIYPFRFKFYRLENQSLGNLGYGKYKGRNSTTAFDILLYNYISYILHFSNKEQLLKDCSHGLIESMLKNLIIGYYFKSFGSINLNIVAASSYLYLLKLNKIIYKQRGNILYNIGSFLNKLHYKYGINERYYKALTHYQGLMKEISFNGVYNLMHSVKNTNRYLYRKSYIVKSLFYLDSFGKVYNYKPQFYRSCYPFYDLIFFFKKNLSNILRTYSQYKLNKKMKLFHKKRFSYNERFKTYPLQIKDILRYQDHISFLKTKLLEVLNLSNNFYIFSKNINILVKNNQYVNQSNQKLNLNLKKKKGRLGVISIYYIIHTLLSKLAYVSKQDYKKIKSELINAMAKSRHILFKTTKTPPPPPSNSLSLNLKSIKNRQQGRFNNFKKNRDTKKFTKRVIRYNPKQLLEAINLESLKGVRETGYGLSNKYYTNSLNDIKAHDWVNSFYNPVSGTKNEIKNAVKSIKLKKGIKRRKTFLNLKYLTRTNSKTNSQLNVNRLNKRFSYTHPKSHFTPNTRYNKSRSKPFFQNISSNKFNRNRPIHPMNIKSKFGIQNKFYFKDKLGNNSLFLKKVKPSLPKLIKLTKLKKKLKKAGKKNTNKQYTLRFLKKYYPYPSRVMTNYIYKAKGNAFEYRKKKKFLNRFIPMRKLRIQISSYDYYKIRQMFQRHNKLRTSRNQLLLNFLYKYKNKTHTKSTKLKASTRRLGITSFLNRLRQPFLNYSSYKRRFLEIINFYWKKFEYKAKLLLNNLGFYKIINNYHNMYKGSNPIPVFFSTKWITNQYSTNKINNYQLNSHNLVRWLSDLTNMVPNYINKLTHLNRYFISKGNLPYKYLTKSPYYYIKLRQKKKIKIDKFDIRYIPSFWYKEQELKRIYKKLLKPYKENIKKAFKHNYSHFNFYKHVINHKLGLLRYKKIKANKKKTMTIGELVFSSLLSSLNATKIYRGSYYYNKLYKDKATKLVAFRAVKSILNKNKKKKDLHSDVVRQKNLRSQSSFLPNISATWLNTRFNYKKILIKYLLNNIHRNPKFIYKILVKLDWKYKYYYPNYNLFRNKLAYRIYVNKMHSKRYDRKKRFFKKRKLITNSPLARLYKKKPHKYMHHNNLRLIGDNCKKLLLYIKSNVTNKKPQLINHLKHSRYRNLSSQEKKHKGLLLNKHLFGTSPEAINYNLSKYYKLHAKEKQWKHTVQQLGTKKQKQLVLSKYKKRNRLPHKLAKLKDSFYIKYNLTKLISKTVSNYQNYFISSINSLGITNNSLNRFIVIRRETPLLAKSYKILRRCITNKSHLFPKLLKKKRSMAKKKTSLLLYLTNPKNIRSLKKKCLLFKYIYLLIRRYNAIICKRNANFIVLQINKRPQFLSKVIGKDTRINSFFYYKSPYKLVTRSKVTTQQYLNNLTSYITSSKLLKTVPYFSYLKRNLDLNNYLEKAKVIYKSNANKKVTSLTRKNKIILFFLFTLKASVNYNLKNRLYNQLHTKCYNLVHTNPSMTNHNTYRHGVLLNNNYNYTIRNKIRSIRIVKHLQNINNTMISTKLSYNYTFFMYLFKTIATHISRFLKKSFYVNYNNRYDLTKTIPTFLVKNGTKVTNITYSDRSKAKDSLKTYYFRHLKKFRNSRNMRKIITISHKITMHLLSLIIRNKQRLTTNKQKDVLGTHYTYSPSSININRFVNKYKYLKKRMKVTKKVKRFYKYTSNNILKVSDLRYNSRIESSSKQFKSLLQYLPTVTSIYSNIYNTLIHKFNLLLYSPTANNNNQLLYFLEKHGFFYKNTFYFLKLLKSLTSNLYNYINLNIISLSYTRIKKNYFNQIYKVSNNTISNIEYMWTRYIYYNSKLPSISIFSSIRSLSNRPNSKIQSLNSDKVQSLLEVNALEKDFNKKPLSIKALSNIKYYLNRDFTSYLQLNYVMEYDTNKLIGSKENILYFYGVSGPSNFYNSAFLLNPKLVTDYFYFGVKHKVQIYQLFSDVTEAFKDLSYLQIILDKVYSKLFYRTMHYYLDILLDSFYAKLRKDLKMTHYNILFKKFRYFSKLIGFLSYITDLQSHFNLKGLHIISTGRRSRVLRTHKRLWQRGPMSLNTFSDNIDYYYKPIISKFGIMGLKVFLYKEPRHKNPLYHLIYQSLFLRFRLLKTVLNNKTNSN